MPEMNEKSNKPSLHFILPLISLMLFTFVSCENQKDPLYAGTWQFTETVTADNLVLNTIRTLTLTKKTYEETFLVERENSTSVSEIIGTRGDLSQTHSGMVFQLKELGTCIRDASDACTGNVQWNGQGSKYWDDNIPFFKLIVPGGFEADESTLWLTRDLNNDGDTADAGEDILFERI
jgi:hypothetical protein